MKLPIGIQTFEKIRSEDYIYIDKTPEVYELINNHSTIFLSRPRRFGKSLFLDTLKCVFEGKKELFEGLYIYDKHDFSQTYPVIKISFSGNLTTEKGLDQTIKSILKSNIKNLGMDWTFDENKVVAVIFNELIEAIYAKYRQKVVVLVDEYDKPILDNITNPQMAEHAREQLKSFYEVLKNSDAYLKFVFLTGVSKFSKVSIFSGLNNLDDITLDAKYGNICGYTQNDIETSFAPLLQGVDLAELKTWYNGYNFLKDAVYNPFDILLFIGKGFEYRNYWFTSGSPSFLIKLIKERNYYLPNLNNISIGTEVLDSFDINNINLEVLLFQAGYLTIEEKMQKPRGGIAYKLKLPNKEVQLSFNDVILDMLLNKPTERENFQDTGYLALEAGNIDEFMQSLKYLLAGLPYENFTKNNINVYEGFYASLLYVYLSSLGLKITPEHSMSRGRIDMSVEIADKVYIMEFKMGMDKNALEQIKEKRYFEKFPIDADKQVYLVGINFDESQKNIGSYDWQVFTK